MKFLRPFFNFYGSKWLASPYYPMPIYDTIIEPFAGSAGYSLRNYDKKVCLYDIDPVICGMWDYLIKASSEEIMKLPTDENNMGNIPQEAKWLIGFWLAHGSSHPRKTRSPWGKRDKTIKNFWGSEIIQRIATQVKYIRHWSIHNNSYEKIENKYATWFIDPPYIEKGFFYLYHKIDYVHLGEWSKNRDGQIIVCEQDGSSWLPFEKFKNTKSILGNSKEVIWTKNATWMDV